MRAFDFETYDVFTDKKFTGNQLAVLLDARGLTTEEMQTITREFNVPETTFIFPAENDANTARVRIFTIGYEMPFAGHPTVGTAIAIARLREQFGELRLELNAGLFPVEVKEDDGQYFAEFKNPNLPKETGAAPSPEAIEAALSLPSGTVDRNGHKPRKIGAGVNFIYACAPLAVVQAARLNSSAFEELKLEETVGLYLYAAEGEDWDGNYHARMFAPGAGINEDPATGSAAAAFPGQIALSEKLSDGEHRWVIEQGFEMGRPSRIIARVETQGGAVTSVRIGGQAVPVQKGQIFA
jgi:trans-2,3-dihydro-3-hydroxyanthranilate isomerase